MLEREDTGCAHSKEEICHLVRKRRSLPAVFSAGNFSRAMAMQCKQRSSSIIGVASSWSARRAQHTTSSSSPPCPPVPAAARHW